MVLEARQEALLAAELGLDRDVADQPRALLADRAQVGEAEAGQRLLAELVALAEQLVAAADGEQGGAVVDRRGERRRAWSRPCRRRRRAGRGPGRRRCRRGRARPGRSTRPARRRCQREVDPPPLAAPLQEEDVAAVGVDVHLVGIEAEDAELHHSSSPRTTTVEPTWSSVGVDVEAFDRHQADLGRLGLELVGGQGADRHLVGFVGQLAGRRDLLAQPVDDDVLGPDRRFQRQARVDPAVDLADVGEERLRPLRAPACPRPSPPRGGRRGGAGRRSSRGRRGARRGWRASAAAASGRGPARPARAARSRARRRAAA